MIALRALCELCEKSESRMILAEHAKFAKQSNGADPERKSGRVLRDNPTDVP
jgi:hypothetical protein